jgi:hypothetical protein
MKIGAREKLAIVRTSAASFSGERNAGACRRQICRYAEREPPQTAQSCMHPRVVRSRVIG